MSFVIEHIDSLIMILVAVGLLATSGRISNPRRASFVRAGAWVMIVAGSLLMLTAVGPSGSVLQKTDDGVASASFPGAPERRFLSASETADGSERETYDYKPPGRDLNYKLSRSPITGPAVEWSDDQRVDAMIAYFESQKVTVSDRTSIKAGDITGHAFSFTSPDGNATSSIRVAFAGGQAYRVIATAGRNESAPAEFEKFLSSFRVSPK